MYNCGLHIFSPADLNCREKAQQDQVPIWQRKSNLNLPSERLQGRLAAECPVVFLTLEELSRLMGKDQSTLNVTSNREALTQFCHWRTARLLWTIAHCDSCRYFGCICHAHMKTSQGCSTTTCIPPTVTCPFYHFSCKRQLCKQTDNCICNFFLFFFLSPILLQCVPCTAPLRTFKCSHHSKRKTVTDRKHTNSLLWVLPVRMLFWNRKSRNSWYI